MAQILIFSILISALYALVAIGFTMIFGVANVLNLAHGAFIMAAAYAAYVLSVSLNLNIYLSFILAIFFTALLAIATYKGLVRYIQHSPVITMIVTLAFALILQQLVIYFFGDTPKNLKPLIGGTTALLGVTVENNRILAFIISCIVIGLLWLFVGATKAGKAIMATSQDRIGAALAGIDPEHIYTITWGISGALAAVAGIFLASLLTMVPYMWIDPLIIAFAVVILGGLGSIRGSLIAAYIVGFVETLTVYLPRIAPTAWLGGPRWSGLASLVILIIILILRPQGLFGREMS